jgi:hypothetical protein
MTGDGWGDVPEGTERVAPVPSPAAPTVRPWSPVDPVSGSDAPPTPWSSASTTAVRVSGGRARGGLGVAAGTVAVAVVVALLVGLGLVLPRALSSGTGARAVAGAGSGSSATGSSTDPGSGSADRESAIESVLARRGAAVTRDDAAGWRRTQTAAAKAPQFARLAALPVTRWAYEIRSLDPGKDVDTAVLDVGLHLRYDVDTTDAVIHERVTVRHGSSGWLVVAETTAGRRAQPWELGALSVVHGTRSLVIGIDTPTSTLRSYAALVDATVPDVNAVWGTGWNQRPVLVVPHTVAQLGRALGRTPASLASYAAVTTGEVRGDDDAVPALRVWLNTPSMAELSALGREVVVRHELTHVATDAPGTPDVPLWLEEGFAEYVGYRGSGIALTDELRELLRVQRSGSVPAHLPTQETFDGSDVDLAYEGADLACRVIAEKYGQKQLVRLYRLTVAGRGTEEANLEAALRTVTGSGTAALETAWHARLRALAS